MLIEGFENYKVFADGRVKSLYTKKYLKPMNQNGYLVVRLYKDKQWSDFLVHRLVAKHFIGDSDMEINHIDGDKTNNAVENLEYCTRQENIQHGFYNQLYNNKFSPEEIVEIRELYATGDFYQHELAELYKCSQTLISRIVNKKRYNYVSNI